MGIDRRSFLALLPATGLLSPTGCSSRSETLSKNLRAAIDDLPVIDSHEHIISESERVSSKVDFFTLAGHYAINDVISAGLPSDAQTVVRDQEAPDAKRWAAFEPYWNFARYTGYGQALRIAIRDIYGFDEISGATIARINEAIQEKNKPGFYEHVLRERSGIRYALVDDYWNPVPVKLEGEIFALARKFDQFIMPGGSKRVDELEEQTGVAITSLGGLKAAMEKSFEQAIGVGMVAVKSTVAYSRQLLFEEVSEADAEREFSALMRDERAQPDGFRQRLSRPYRKLEDHMFHHVIRLAESHGYPVQIHTGLLAGNGGFITNTNSTGLTNLFFLYPNVTFDLFHISYPYQRELGVAAKLFPNVHIDFCWAHIISPKVSRQALGEYLETVPVNKIFGYGGDYRYPELSYAHLVMARRNIAAVLAAKVEEGIFDEEQALEIARLLLHDNPARVFPMRPTSSS